MPYSVVDKPSKYFDTQLFTGTNTSGRTFTGLNFQPDMIWGKQRDSASYNHFIVDVVRGGSKFIATNSTASEDNKSHGEITSWNSDGTTWVDGTNATYPRLYYNDNGQLGGSGTRVWWQWKANGAGVSNTAGSISSTVSANTTSGFSIVSYTYTSGNVTVGHGLGVAPSMIIVKARSVSDNWRIYHKSLGNSAFVPFTTAAQTTGSTAWNSTSPTSSVFSLGSFWGGTDTHIAYCFAEIKGFSKFSSFTGNGSTDGAFVYTGFKPAFIITKITSETGSWFLHDNKRNGYNGANNYVYPNASDAELTTQLLDITSNGFKMRFAGGANSSGTSIYMAFAENPFVSSKGIACTAR